MGMSDPVKSVSWTFGPVGVIGLGNVLMGDDAFGPCVVQTLLAEFAAASGIDGTVACAAGFAAGLKGGSQNIFYKGVLIYFIVTECKQLFKLIDDEDLFCAGGFLCCEQLTQRSRGRREITHLRFERRHVVHGGRGLRVLEVGGGKPAGIGAVQPQRRRRVMAGQQRILEVILPGAHGRGQRLLQAPHVGDQVGCGIGAHQQVQPGSVRPLN